MSCYSAFLEAHRKVIDAGYIASRATNQEKAQEQYAALVKDIVTALHLTYPQEEINAACDAFLKTSRAKY
jgi:hypothetical protein